MSAEPNPTMSQPTSSFKVGDRVRLRIPNCTWNDHLGVLVKIDAEGGVFPCTVLLDSNEHHIACATDEVRHPSELLIALAEALGAVEHNSWVDAGLLCRRYITSDGSIDLTVRVP